MSNSADASDSSDAKQVVGQPNNLADATKLRCTSVAKSYKGRGGNASVDALSGVDLHVYNNELVCLLGTSGCGKSTLLNIIGGLETASEGVVEVDGGQVVGPGPDRGMVFQSYSLFPWKSVRKNVSFGLEVAGWSHVDRVERVDELLGVVGLSEFSDALPRELSGGMRQRVAIARALAPEPDILLLDEPFGALDAHTRRSLQEFLLALWQRTRVTILMVTHDVDEAIYLSQRLYVMKARPGRISEEIAVPFGNSRGPMIKRDRRFLDLSDGIEDQLR